MYWIKLSVIFTLLSQVAFTAVDRTCSGNILEGLTENKKLKGLQKLAAKAQLAATNGIEVEGIIPFWKNSVYSITENLTDHLKQDWGNLVKNIRRETYHDPPKADGYRLHFEFKGRPKNIIISYENLSKTAEHNKNIGVELSSHIIEDQDDYLLFLSLQDKFFDSGVIPEPVTAGIHNHVGLKDTLGRTVKHAMDKDIKQFTLDFKKIEDQVFDYFGTHPFRSHTSGPIHEDFSPNNKVQAVILSTGNNPGEYRTLEFRYLNSMNDPEAIIESTNFNNQLVKEYFNPKSGVKEWFAGDKHNLKDLFKLLDLPYKKKNHFLKALRIPFDPQKNYFNVFGKNRGKVLGFIGRYLGRNKENPQHIGGVLNEALKYITLLTEKYKIPEDKLNTFINKFLDTGLKVVPAERMLPLLVRAPKFRYLPLSTRKLLIERIKPGGLTKLPDEQLMSILRDNMSLIFRDYPFKKAELDYFNKLAVSQKDAKATANLLPLKYKNLDKYILSLKRIKDDFRQKVYEELLRDERAISGMARAHITNLITRRNANK